MQSKSADGTHTLSSQQKYVSCVRLRLSAVSLTISNTSKAVAWQPNRNNCWGFVIASYMRQSSHICTFLNEPNDARTTKPMYIHIYTYSIVSSVSRAGSLAHGGPYRGCRSPVLVRFAVNELIGRHIWNVHPRRRLPSHFISLFNVIFFYNKYIIGGSNRNIWNNLLFDSWFGLHVSCLVD